MDVPGKNDYFCVWVFVVCFTSRILHLWVQRVHKSEQKVMPQMKCILARSSWVLCIKTWGQFIQLLSKLTRFSFLWCIEGAWKFWSELLFSVSCPRGRAGVLQTPLYMQSKAVFYLDIRLCLMFHLEKWVDFNRLGKLVILLVADAGAGGSVGSSSPAYPD